MIIAPIMVTVQLLVLASWLSKVGAMAKGFLPHCSVKDFPEEPRRLAKLCLLFLHCWFREGLKKPDGRKALKVANPGLSLHDRNIILGKLQLYRPWAQKKKRI